MYLVKGTEEDKCFIVRFYVIWLGVRLYLLFISAVMSVDKISSNVLLSALSLLGSSKDSILNWS